MRVIYMDQPGTAQFVDFGDGRGFIMFDRDKSATGNGVTHARLSAGKDKADAWRIAREQGMTEEGPTK